MILPDKEYYPEEYEQKIQEAKEHMTEWIRFFLEACISQVDKNISKIDLVNALYENVVNKARQITHTTTLIDVIDMIFKYPIFTTVKIMYSDDAVRNRKYYFYDLISIIS